MTIKQIEQKLNSISPERTEYDFAKKFQQLEYARKNSVLGNRLRIASLWGFALLLFIINFGLLINTKFESNRLNFLCLLQIFVGITFFFQPILCYMDYLYLKAEIEIELLKKKGLNNEI